MFDLRAGLMEDGKWMTEEGRYDDFLEIQG